MARERGCAVGDAMTIQVMASDGSVEIDRASFTSLLENSVAHDRASYRDALASGQIPLADLVKLGRVAEIPYPLFFAPPEVVDAQLKHKSETLLAGISKREFSMNSRSPVHLRDVELIVKDILRKQEFLKQHDSLADNTFVGSLRRAESNGAAAAHVRATFGIDTAELRSIDTKREALEWLIKKFEAQQLYVSRSQQQQFMPQRLNGVKFSGLCVKDKKVPYIFLTGGDAGESFEPDGRKVFTLVLLACLVGFGRFSPVTYDDHTAELIEDREYLVAQEVLMPASEVRALTVTSLDKVIDHAARFKVTPSAFVMRASRLGLVESEVVAEFFSELRAEFLGREERPPRRANQLNAIRRYSGAELSRRTLALLDQGTITPIEFCRVTCLNNIKPAQIPEFRARLERAL